MRGMRLPHACQFWKIWSDAAQRNSHIRRNIQSISVFHSDDHHGVEWILVRSWLRTNLSCTKTERHCSWTYRAAQFEELFLHEVIIAENRYKLVENGKNGIVSMSYPAPWSIVLPLMLWWGIYIRTCTWINFSDKDLGGLTAIFAEQRRAVKHRDIILYFTVALPPQKTIRVPRRRTRPQVWKPRA
jgi:hypothetical protein